MLQPLGDDREHRHDRDGAVLDHVDLQHADGAVLKAG
jgi:hypothetical protein